MISQYDLVPYRGKSLMFWALEWFRMSNDCFYEIYGYNFNPHDYPLLYEQARERIANINDKADRNLRRK